MGGHCLMWRRRARLAGAWTFEECVRCGGKGGRANRDEDRRFKERVVPERDRWELQTFHIC